MTFVNIYVVTSTMLDLGEEPMYGDQHQYKYMTVDDMKSLGDDSMRMDVTRDEKGDYRHSYGEFCRATFLH